MSTLAPSAPDLVDASRQIDTTIRVDIPSAAPPPPPDEPPKPPSLQELLDLPQRQVEERSYEEKFDRVMTYAKEKAANRGGHFFRLEPGRTKEGYIGWSLEKNLGVVEKAQRKMGEWSMKRAGIENPEAIMHFLEKNTGAVLYDQIPSKAIVSVLSHLDPDNQARAYGTLERGFDRLHKMTLFPDQTDFTSKEFADNLSLIAKMPEDEFEKVFKEIDQYAFIQKSPYMTNKDDRNVLFDIFKAGGLTQQQKDILDKEQLWVQTAGEGTLKEDKNYVEFHDVFNPQVVSRINSHIPYIVDFADHQLTVAAQRPSDNDLVLMGRNFIESLDFLEKNGALPVLDELKKRGWSLQTTYYNMDSDSYRWTETRDLIADRIRKASAFAGNEEKVAFVRSCEQYFFNLPIDPSRINIYEAMIAKRKQLTDVALVLHRLPKADHDIYLQVVTANNGREVHIDYQNLVRKIREDANLDQLPMEERGFALHVHQLLSSMSYGMSGSGRASDYMPLIASIAKHDNIHDVFDEMIVGQPKTAFVNTILTDETQLPKDSIKVLLTNCTSIQDLDPEVKWKYLDLFRYTHQKKQALDSLPESFIETLPITDQEFIHAIKPLTQEATSFFLDRRELANEYFVDGIPTERCITDAFTNGQAELVNTLLSDTTIASFSTEDQPFWLSFRDMVGIGKDVLISNRERYGEFFVEGKPTAAFLNEIPSSMIIDVTGVRQFDQIVEKAALSSFPPDERAFWQFYKDADEGLKIFLLPRRDRFSDFVVDGKPTAALYQTRFLEEPGFVFSADRTAYRHAFGEPTIGEFLDALPTRTDEKRNAFTHNDYDRTSDFIKYLVETSGLNFQLTLDNFRLLTPYITQFGLAKNVVLFHYFSNLYQLEQGTISTLPDDIASSGVTSTEQLRHKLTELSARMYSKEPMTDLSQLSNFDKEMLKFLTGKSSHRFDLGRPSMETIMTDFQADMAAGEIEPLPEGYIPVELEIPSVRIEFETEPIKEDFETLSGEILSAIEKPDNTQALVVRLRSMLDAKSTELQLLIGDSEGGKKQYMMREQTKMQEYSEKLASMSSPDELLTTLLDMQFSDTNQQRIVNSVFRQVIFGKVFQKNYSPGFMQEIQTQLESGINAGSIETVINIVDEMAKTHALNLQDNNKDGYWTEEAFAKIQKSKRAKDLPKAFNPHVGKLKEVVEQFQKIETGSNKVQIIPDRGFVGEMSGYLADVCYTKEYPLLKKWPNVVPYKFVQQNPATGEPEFIGSVLVFSLDDNQGNPSLLMRAFDVPNESSMDINSFIESFLDKVAVPVAQATGKTRILVPGNSGAISNYQMSINHIRGHYITEDKKVSLQERFKFNDYDLTNNSYTVREIPLVA